MKSKYVKKDYKRPWFIVNSLLIGVYIFWRLFFTIPFDKGFFSAVFGLIFLLTDLLVGTQIFVHFKNMFETKKISVPVVPPDYFPNIDIMITVNSQPKDVVYKSINACKFLEYPDKSKVHIFVCDIKERHEIRELSSNFGFNYIPGTSRIKTKAAMQNFSLASMHSPYILALDGDVIPTSSFLMDTIPFIINEEINNEDRAEDQQVKIGFIQTPISYYDGDLLGGNLFSERRIPQSEDYYYTKVQPSANKHNCAAFCGTNCVMAREAIERIGGFSESDINTGIKIQKAHYKTIATDTVLASGLSPNSLKTLVREKIDWVKSLINSVVESNLLFTSSLSIWQKVSYTSLVLHAFFPLKILIYILAPLMYSLLGFTVIKFSFWRMLAFWLPMYLANDISLRLLSGKKYSIQWNYIYETLLFPFLLIPVIGESVGTFQRGGRTRAKARKKYYNSACLIPYIFFIVLSLIASVYSIKFFIGNANTSYLVIFLWLIVNIFTLVLATMFVTDRKNHRESERLAVQVDCLIKEKGFKVFAVTCDMSETGVSVLSDEEIYLPADENISLELSNVHYKAVVKAQVIHVEKTNKLWKYAFTITEISESQRSQYCQILYDRNHKAYGKQYVSPIRVFAAFLRKKIGRHSAISKKTPKYYLDTACRTEAGNIVRVLDFSYDYITVKNNIPQSNITIILNRGIKLICKKRSSNEENINLYKVVNIKDIYRDEAMRDKLRAWINENSKEREDESIRRKIYTRITGARNAG